MAISSVYPELNQPLPRRVQFGSGFFISIVCMIFALLITGIPISAIIYDQYRNKALDNGVLSLFLIFAIFYLVCLSYIVWRYFKEKELIRWGQIAEAAVIEGPEESTGKGARSMLVEYGFEDANGNSITGSRRFPARSNKTERARESLRKLEHPIVVYDPKNSDRNILYPGYYAVCAPPK